MPSKSFCCNSDDGDDVLRSQFGVGSTAAMPPAGMPSVMAGMSFAPRWRTVSMRVANSWSLPGKAMSVAPVEE